jgi:hypothetical protein
MIFKWNINIIYDILFKLDSIIVNKKIKIIKIKFIWIVYFIFRKTQIKWIIIYTIISLISSNVYQIFCSLSILSIYTEL